MKNSIMFALNKKTRDQMAKGLVACLLWLAIMSCSGCGGGGGADTGSNTASATLPASAPVATSTTQPQNTPVRLLLHGDSTMWGSCGQANDPNCVSGRSAPTPAQMMQADLDRMFGTGKVIVEDGSVPGSKLQDDVTGTVTFDVPLATALSTADADIVATNSEINDLATGEAPATYNAYLEQWVQTVRASAKLPLLIEPNPVCTTFQSTTYTQQQFLAMIRSLAAAESVTLLTGYDAFTQVNPTPIGSDCIHPTYAGYVFKESQYIKTLAPLIQGILSARGLL